MEVVEQRDDLRDVSCLPVVSQAEMAEHYVHLANTDPGLETAFSAAAPPG
ncbi:hypothetical protein [Streptomyces mirabilis]